jgi:lipopolysaccharide export system permease protein
MRDIPNLIADQQTRVDQTRQALALRSGLKMLSGDFDELANQDARNLENQLRDTLGSMHRLQTEPPRRWANGFSCLAFVLVGAPMAIRRRNSDLMSSFFMCFGPILIVYYPFLLVGVDRAKRGEIPPECVWIGNIMLALWGLWLLKKVFRY